MIINSRIEDVKFTPNKEYIMLPDYRNDIIYLIKEDQQDQPITLRSTNNGIKVPHGIYFINNELFVVANRNNRKLPDGFITVFRMPTIIPGQMEYEITPIAKYSEKMASGVVSYIRDTVTVILVVCNDNKITKYTLNGDKLQYLGILVQNELNLPDGISINSDATLIACSNHNTGQVLIYQNNDSLNSRSKPIGYLAGQLLPHGLSFSTNDEYIIVADAGSPYIFIYHDKTKKWTGNNNCYKAIRVIDKFIQENIEEGGPKGIDIRDSKVLISSEYDILTIKELDLLLEVDDDTHLKHLCRLSKEFKGNVRYSRRWQY